MRVVKIQSTPLWFRCYPKINAERPSQIDAGVRHFAQGEAAALIRVHPLSIDKVLYITAEKLFRCEIPEGRPSK